MWDRTWLEMASPCSIAYLIVTVIQQLLATRSIEHAIEVSGRFSGATGRQSGH